MPAPIRIVVVITLLVVALAPAPPRAAACENVVLRERSAVLRDFERAEQFLETGWPGRTIDIIDRNSLFAEMRAYQLLDRARHLRAIAAIRLGGHMEHHGGERHPGPEAIEQTLRGALSELSSWSDTSPRAIQWLAEAQLAQVHDDGTHAIAALRELAANDVMPDAYGYAALARATTGAESAGFRARCAHRAGSAARRICPRATRGL